MHLETSFTHLVLSHQVLINLVNSKTRQIMFEKQLLNDMVKETNKPDLEYKIVWILEWNGASGIFTITKKGNKTETRTYNMADNIQSDGLLLQLQMIKNADDELHGFFIKNTQFTDKNGDGNQDFIFKPNNENQQRMIAMTFDNTNIAFNWYLHE